MSLLHFSVLPNAQQQVKSKVNFVVVVETNLWNLAEIAKEIVSYSITQN